jgi:uncharacterized membrane protein YczE
MQKILEVSFQRWCKLLTGLGCYGIGLSFMKQSQLGLSPWDVLHDGLSKITGAQIGTISIYVGILVLLLWIPIREKPGIGTVLNIFVVGIVTNLTLPIILIPDQLWLKIVWLVVGLLLIGLATALYLGSRLGAGPRDGLMTGIHRRSSWSIRLIRTGIELSVLLIGLLFGGTIGIGTLAYAFGIGPLIQVMFHLTGDQDLISHPTRT